MSRSSRTVGCLVAAALSLQPWAAAQAPEAGRVDIVFPPEGSYVSGVLTVKVAVAGEGVVARRIQMFADGTLLCVVETEPFECSWDAGESVREHRLRVVAELVDGRRLSQERTDGRRRLRRAGRRRSGARSGARERRRRVRPRPRQGRLQGLRGWHAPADQHRVGRQRCARPRGCRGHQREHGAVARARETGGQRLPSVAEARRPGDAARVQRKRVHVEPRGTPRPKHGNAASIGSLPGEEPRSTMCSSRAWTC